MQSPGNSPHAIDLNTWFSEQLDAQHPDLQYSEQLWDRRAAEVSSFTVSADDLALQTVQQRLQLKGSRVLEISFGGGRHLLEFARHGARVSGVEISANMIAHTRDKLRQLGPLSQDSELIQSAWENPCGRPGCDTDTFVFGSSDLRTDARSVPGNRAVEHFFQRGRIQHRF